MYAQLSEDDDAPLNGVIYITDRADVARLAKHNAASMRLDSLSRRTLDAVIQQTWGVCRGFLSLMTPQRSAAGDATAPAALAAPAAQDIHRLCGICFQACRST
jgi:hypothetical protein